MPSKPSKLESPDIVGSQKAYDDFLPETQDLPEADVRTFRADASLAYHNVRRGLDAIAPHIDRIPEDLPKIDVAKLQKLDDLALAVIYAAAQVDRSSDGSTPALLEKARTLRDVLLKSADALAAAGLIPLRAVEKSARVKAASTSLRIASTSLPSSPSTPRTSRARRPSPPRTSKRPRPSGPTS